MPELPEVEITARRLSAALAGAEVESALATAVATLKTYDPPLDAVVGRRIAGVRRIGKMLAVDFEPASAGPGSSDGASAGGAAEPPLTLLVHLMSAGRLQVFDNRGSLRDRRSRLLIRLADGRELRLREFGTRQQAWARLLRSSEVDDDEMVATLGPDAWPPPDATELGERLRQPRNLHPLLRDQRVIAGIGRSWVDEVLWRARLSPFKSGSELGDEEVGAIRDGLGALGEAIEHYEEVIGEQVPDKLPMPLQVHRREGERCPRCGDEIAAIYYAEHQTNYCPREQTGGRVLKDRRLSRLLK